VDGFELARWGHENKLEIPLILASGNAGKTNMAAELCGAEFISKPLDFDNIEAKFRETLSRKKPLNSQRPLAALLRPEIGHHHHTNLLRYAQEASRLKDNRRVSIRDASELAGVTPMGTCGM